MLLFTPASRLRAADRDPFRLLCRGADAAGGVWRAHEAYSTSTATRSSACPSRRGVRRRQAIARSGRSRPCRAGLDAVGDGDLAWRRTDGFLHRPLEGRLSGARHPQAHHDAARAARKGDRDAVRLFLRTIFSSRVSFMVERGSCWKPSTILLDPQAKCPGRFS